MHSLLHGSWFAELAGQVLQWQIHLQQRLPPLVSEFPTCCTSKDHLMASGYVWFFSSAGDRKHGQYQHLCAEGVNLGRKALNQIKREN